MADMDTTLKAKMKEIEARGPLSQKEAARMKELGDSFKLYRSSSGDRGVDPSYQGNSKLINEYEALRNKSLGRK